MAKSGLESLLEALAQGGVSVGGAAGGTTVNAENVAADGQDNAGSGAGAQGFTVNSGSGKEAANAFLDKVAGWRKKNIIIAAIVLLVVFGGAYWWFHPAINIHSADLWVFCSIFILLPLWIFLKARQHQANKEKGSANVGAAAMRAKRFKLLSWIPVAIVGIGIIGWILSLSFIPGNAYKYASILETETMEYTADIEEVNYSEIPIIDKDTAAVLGDKELGAIADYVSQFEVSDLYSQINYNGTPVRVSPLNYADLFKWLFNREEGIPAYIIVDMTSQEAQVVRISDIDGTEGSGIKYSQSEPLARNIERYVQLKYPFYMFDEFAFEIDEDGHPWWICPVQTRTIGLFGGTDISRVVLCDAVSGECIDYAIEDCPTWVDRAYPSDLLIEQYNWYGSYLNGWINSWLGQSGVVQTTPGNSGELGYNYIAKDDDVWVYTGVTSATADNSIIGFVLINQRTAESHFYSVVGATETVAMESAEGQVQNLRYTSTFPILINVSDRPTYFMALKDGAGLVKKFAMIDIQNYQRVAVGDTVAETQSTYIDILKRDNVLEEEEPDLSEIKTAQGTIELITQVVLDGNTHVYVMLSGDNNLYDFALPALLSVITYDEGDTITFTYTQEGSACSAVEITTLETPEMRMRG